MTAHHRSPALPPFFRSLLLRFPAVGLVLVATLSLSPSRAGADEAAALVAGLPAHVVAEHIILSYTDPKRCIDLLQTFGYRVVEPGTALDPGDLPSVMVMPSTKFHDLPDPKKSFPQTETDPATNLLVFYDARRPDQLGELMHRIRTVIDTPARQIMIEAMVLEIASGALEQLGVQWDLDRSSLSSGNWLNKNTTGNLQIGHLALPDGGSMADPTLTLTASRILDNFQTQLQALVIERSARILSRPSILTLDNRMAYINVSEKIPVAESRFSGNNYFTQVNFREVTAGIELSVRPRVSEDGGEVGMQISASVTAQKPGEDVVVFGTDSRGNQFEVARAPTLTVREVKTFARVADNTPFIIGGLIAEDDQKAERRVPFLGRMPLLGPLFRTTDERGGRREVIIVITPNVLPEDRSVARTLPKDTDDFDSFGAELFRDAYRIRAEDVFNLEFLTQNRQLTTLQKAADRVVREQQQLADIDPFRSFCQGRIPGENILVYRQIYETTRRQGIEKPIDPRMLIFLNASGDGADIGVGWLARHIERLVADEPGLQNPFEEVQDRRRGKAADDQPPTKAVALTFTERRDSERAGEVLMEPVPKVEVVNCPDRDTWEELLWQMNQPTEGGRRRFTVLLRDPRDVVRLKRAIVLRQAVELNSQNQQQLRLRDFAIGRILLMPTVNPEKTYLVDGEVAQYFFYTNHYYRAVAQVLDAEMDALDTLLRTPPFERYRIAPEPVLIEEDD